MSVYSSFCLFLLALDLDLPVIDSSNPVDAERHLSLGIELTSKGQFGEALSHFHAAVDSDPNNYLTYYRRATVFLALGKSKSALPDLESVIRLKPDFTAALLQKGNILLKQGQLDHAHMSFEAVLRKEPDNPEALQQYSVIDPIKRDVELAFQLFEMGNYEGAIENLAKPMEMCPWDPNLRELRSECYLAIGDSLKAVYDLKFVAKLKGDSTEAHHKLSMLHYQLGEAEESLTEIRECLKLDPDSKLCFPHYKKVKKLAAALVAAKEGAEAQQYHDCVEKAQAAAKIEPSQAAFTLLINTLLCQCLPKAGSAPEGIEACDAALALDEDVNLLCNRAEAHIANDDFDAAIQDYQKALQLEEGASCAQNGIKQAQKLQKQSQKRDYYKILGVKRTATKAEISKAYRKMAQKWHPDSFDGDEKKKAEKNFIDIAAAKEVLTDPEKRQKFDQGEDPLDPESQAGQNFNPFGQGFHHFGGGQGGPFQFRFHFN